MTTPKHKAIAVIQAEGDDYELRIFPDEYARNPDEDDDNCFITFDHRNFKINSKDMFLEPSDIFKKILDLKSIELSNPTVYLVDEYYCIQLYAIIHSGVKLSIDKIYDPFDLSTRGYILYKKDDSTLEKVIEYCRARIDMWNAYNQGNVYRFELVKLETCSYCNHTHETLLDSVSGYYPDEDIIVNMMYNCEIMIKLKEDQIAKFKNVFL